MSDKQYDIKVEGKKNTFEGGAIRHIKDKGRFDLVQPIVLDEMIKHISTKKKHTVSPLELIKSIYSGNYVNAMINITYLHYSNNKKLNKFYDPESGSYNLLMDPENIDRDAIMKYFLIMLKYLAIHFQKGAEKYGERNCEKGIPLSSFYDSATRHTYQFLLGETDEPHHISAIWNCWMAIWTIKTHPERCSDFANMYYSKLHKAPHTHKDPSTTKEILNKAYDLSENINEFDHTILDIIKELSDETDAVIVTAKQRVDETSDNTTENAANECQKKPDVQKDKKEVDKPANDKTNTTTSSEKSEFQSIMDELKSIFAELNIPVITGHQLNKEDDHVVLKVLKRRTPKVSSHIIGTANFDPDEEKELKDFVKMIKKLAESHTYNFNE